jgi:hypothetical protein
MTNIHRVALSGLILFFFSCASLVQFGGDSTLYRSPERARTVLTALQTLRFHSAELVAKAYVTGRISPERAKQFEAIDDKFRASWGVAADLVNLWVSARGTAPRGLQESMAEVESLGAELEQAGREVQ